MNEGRPSPYNEELLVNIIGFTSIACLVSKKNRLSPLDDENQILLA